MSVQRYWLHPTAAEHHSDRDKVLNTSVHLGEQVWRRPNAALRQLRRAAAAAAELLQLRAAATAYWAAAGAATIVRDESAVVGLTRARDIACMLGNG